MTHTAVSKVFDNCNIKDTTDDGKHPLYMILYSALAKIEIAFHKHPGDLDTITDFVTTNYVGEIPSESSRYY